MILRVSWNVSCYLGQYCANWKVEYSYISVEVPIHCSLRYIVLRIFLHLFLEWLDLCAYTDLNLVGKAREEYNPSSDTVL